MYKTVRMKIFVGILAIGICNLMNGAITHPAFPVESPREQGYLRVSAKHQIFYAVYGNVEEIPIVVVHGGPGAGCSDAFTRFFDLKRFKVIMFDQRGAMRSKLFACMEENTTQHSIEDMEALRKHLGIKQWLVFGGSWGSLLSILYGQAYPESCLGFILKDIFLGREQDIRLFGDKSEVPEAYEEFICHIPKEQRSDLLTATYKKIMDSDPVIHMDMARAMMCYHLIRTSNPPLSSTKLESILADDQYVLSIARAVLHYVIHQLFIEPNQAILQMNRIAHLPAIILHGNIDINCSFEQAVLLNNHWENSSLHIIEHVGHSSNDKAMVSAIISATNEFAKKFDGKA